MLLLVVSLGLMVVGCQNDRVQDNEGQMAEFVEVKIMVPDEIKIEEISLLQVQVSQGNDKVNDADKVEFEIWKDGQETHEKIKAEHTKDGIYSIEKAFQEAGSYTIITHVTARSMHSMPMKKFTVIQENK